MFSAFLSLLRTQENGSKEKNIKKKVSQLILPMAAGYFFYWKIHAANFEKAIPLLY